MALYRDRGDAGRRLGELVAAREAGLRDPLVLGIPRGGIAVGYPVAERLGCGLEPVPLRKLPLPDNDQAGFGAVALGGTVVLNEELVRAAGLDRTAIDAVVAEVLAEVRRRDRLYRGGRPFPDLRGRDVLVVDDGLATGYTMLAAIAFVRARQAGRVICAVPVAHREAYEKARGAADAAVCGRISAAYPFAVASFYGDFPDLEDREVTGLLEQARRRTHEERSHAV